MSNRIIIGIAGLFVILAGTFVAAPQTASACSCIGNVPFDESFANADAVFVGTVVGIEDGNMAMPRQGRTIDFEAEEVWKGVGTSAISVFTGWGGGDCGFNFEEGERYVVFANDDAYGGRDGLQTGICNATALVSESGDLLASLSTVASNVPRPATSAEQSVGRLMRQPGVEESLTLVAFAAALLAATLVTSKLRPRVRLGLLLIAAPVLANAAFTGLGVVFNYPQVLQFEPSVVMMMFEQRQGAIMSWFAVLAIGASLVVPISMLLRRHGLRRRAVGIGVAAAFVQVIGLSRWLLLVPTMVAHEEVQGFVTAHVLLGTAIGENAGYVLTAIWTLLVLRDLGRAAFGNVLQWIGLLAALLILTGVLIPFGVHAAVTANFAGYVLWSVWLIALGVRVLRGRVPERTAAAE